MNKAIAAAIEHLGTQAAVAKALRRSQSRISKILNSDTPLPVELAIPLERATKGKVPRWMSRPDLWSRPKGKTNGATLPRKKANAAEAPSQ